MKKYLALLVFILGMVMVSSLLFAGQSPGTGIKLTSHDLSRAGRGLLWGAPTAVEEPLDRICIYCHAPHNTITPDQAVTAGITYYPLWNHDVTNLTYLLYTNTETGDVPNSIAHQLNATLNQPGSISKLCLSCHDGSVAVSSYGNFNPTSSRHTGTKYIDGTSKFGVGISGNLQNHHPIGFDYTEVQIADDEIRDPVNALLGPNPYGLTVNDLLFGGKMECASCHDVHNTKNTGLKFTWVEDTQSNLCLSCHAK